MKNAVSTHIIQRQIIDLDIDDKKQASDIQNRISLVYYAQVIPLLDDIFSSFELTESSIRIDQLELDLGRLDLANLEDELIAQLKPQMEEKLTQVVYKARQNQTQKGVQITSEIDKQQSGIGLFYHYLETGFFPWYSKSEDKDLEKLVELFASIDWSVGNQKSKLLKLFQNDTSRRRIIDLLKPEKLMNICVRIDPSNTAIIIAIQKEMLSSLNQIIDQSYLKNLLSFISLDRLLKDLLVKNAPLSNQRKISAYTSQLLLELFNKNQSISPLSAKQIKKLKQINTTEFRFLDKNELKKISDALVFEKKVETKILKKPASFQTKIEETEKIEISNAGIIILWPYLQIFFRELGLVKDHEFIQEEAQWKAVHLLHYLCTGEEKTEEHELTLHKLFCQLLIDAFVPTKFELSDIEKEECEHLLETVIKNWPVLKNTSNKGFRGTFLKREGILSKDDNGWLIQIERKSHDILLDRLNWSISNIKFPWNNYLIKVKW